MRSRTKVSLLYLASTVTLVLIREVKSHTHPAYDDPEFAANSYYGTHIDKRSAPISAVLPFLQRDDSGQPRAFRMAGKRRPPMRYGKRFLAGRMEDLAPPGETIDKKWNLAPSKANRAQMKFGRRLEPEGSKKYDPAMSHVLMAGGIGKRFGKSSAMLAAAFGKRFDVRGSVFGFGHAEGSGRESEKDDKRFYPGDDVKRFYPGDDIKRFYPGDDIKKRFLPGKFGKRGYYHEVMDGDKRAHAFWMHGKREAYKRGFYPGAFEDEKRRIHPGLWKRFYPGEFEKRGFYPGAMDDDEKRFHPDDKKFYPGEMDKRPSPSSAMFMRHFGKRYLPNDRKSRVDLINALRARSFGKREPEEEEFLLDGKKRGMFSGSLHHQGKRMVPARIYPLLRQGRAPLAFLRTGRAPLAFLRTGRGPGLSSFGMIRGARAPLAFLREGRPGRPLNFRNGELYGKRDYYDSEGNYIEEPSATKRDYGGDSSGLFEQQDDTVYDDGHSTPVYFFGKRNYENYAEEEGSHGHPAFFGKRNYEDYDNGDTAGYHSFFGKRNYEDYDNGDTAGYHSFFGKRNYEDYDSENGDTAGYHSFFGKRNNYDEFGNEETGGQPLLLAKRYDDDEYEHSGYNFTPMFGRKRNDGFDEYYSEQENGGVNPSFFGKRGLGDQTHWKQGEASGEYFGKRRLGDQSYWKSDDEGGRSGEYFGKRSKSNYWRQQMDPLDGEYLGGSSAEIADEGTVSGNSRWHGGGRI